MACGISGCGSNGGCGSCGSCGGCGSNGGCGSCGNERNGLFGLIGKLLRGTGKAVGSLLFGNGGCGSCGGCNYTC